MTKLAVKPASHTPSTNSKLREVQSTPKFTFARLKTSRTPEIVPTIDIRHTILEVISFSQSREAVNALEARIDQLVASEKALISEIHEFSAFFHVGTAYGQ